MYGEGVYMNEKEDVFVGEFMNNKKNGKGILTLKDGRKI